MSLHRRRAFHRQRMGSRDANHAAIRDGLRKLGYLVVDLPGAGDGVADLVVYDRGNNAVWVEVKTAKGALRKSQQDFFAQLDARGIHHGVARTLDEALVLVGHDMRGVAERNADETRAKIARALAQYGVEP